MAALPDAVAGFAHRGDANFVADGRIADAQHRARLGRADADARRAAEVGFDLHRRLRLPQLRRENDIPPVAVARGRCVVARDRADADPGCAGIGELLDLMPEIARPPGDAAHIPLVATVEHPRPTPPPPHTPPPPRPP